MVKKKLRRVIAGPGRPPVATTSLPNPVQPAAPTPVKRVVKKLVKRVKAPLPEADDRTSTPTAPSPPTPTVEEDESSLGGFEFVDEPEEAADVLGTSQAAPQPQRAVPVAFSSKPSSKGQSMPALKRAPPTPPSPSTKGKGVTTSSPPSTIRPDPAEHSADSGVDLEDLTSSIGGSGTLLEKLGEGLDAILQDELENLQESLLSEGDALAPSQTTPEQQGGTTRTRASPPPPITPVDPRRGAPRDIDESGPELRPAKPEQKVKGEKKKSAPRLLGRQLTTTEGDVRERRVISKIAKNFDRLPANMRNELIKNLSKASDPKVREDVVYAIAAYYEQLPLDLQELLERLMEDPESRIREEVVFETARNFDSLPASLREGIYRKATVDSSVNVREIAVSVLSKDYSELPPDLQKRLFTLAEDSEPSVRDEVRFEVSKPDSELPASVRMQLRKTLG